jgi:hypothetical protein
MNLCSDGDRGQVTIFPPLEGRGFALSGVDGQRDGEHETQE